MKVPSGPWTSCRDEPGTAEAANWGEAICGLARRMEPSCGDTAMVPSWGGVMNWGWPRWARLIWGMAGWRLVVPAGSAATGGELSSDKEEEDESWDVFNEDCDWL